MRVEESTSSSFFFSEEEEKKKELFVESSSLSLFALLCPSLWVRSLSKRTRALKNLRENHGLRAF